MKVLLMVVSVLLSGVVGEQAPYAPSGWRPDGPAFELPQRTQPPQKQRYLPPVDPRRPLPPNNFDDNVDVAVQGLPEPEQQPLFQVSPINGQQYTGPIINADIGRLNPSFQQAQYQQQLEKERQFARQREFEATRAQSPSNGLPTQQSPRQFAFQTTTTTTTAKPEPKTQKPEATTEPTDLNEGENFDDDKEPTDKDEKVSVEVSKQNIQEYRPELFLSALAQLNAQPQFISLAQLGQLRAPVYYQPEQAAPVSQGFDGPAHLSALPSVLAQRQLLSQQALAPNQGFAQNPIIVQQQPALFQEPLNQYQPIIKEYQPEQQDVQTFPQYQSQPAIVQPQVLNQIQPNQFPQPAQQPNAFVQPQQPSQQPNLFIQPQQPNQFAQPQQPNFFIQPQQPNQFAQPQQPNLFLQPQQPTQFAQPQQPSQFPQPQKPKDVEEIEQNDQQVVYQNYQPQFYQPQPANPYQNLEQQYFLAQPALNYQNQDQIYQNQFIPQQYDPSQYEVQSQQSFQDQNALQSGLDINQQGNGIDQAEEPEENEEEEGPKATAVATAFGTRTQPRVFAQYGAPTQTAQETTTTEATTQDENEPEDAPAVAQATAVASGRRNARFRSRRVRPIFTVDRSGHLVLSQNQ